MTPRTGRSAAHGKQRHANPRHRAPAGQSGRTRINAIHARHHAHWTPPGPPRLRPRTNPASTPVPDPASSSAPARRPMLTQRRQAHRGNPLVPARGDLPVAGPACRLDYCSAVLIMAGCARSAVRTRWGGTSRAAGRAARRQHPAPRGHRGQGCAARGGRGCPGRRGSADRGAGRPGSRTRTAPGQGLRDVIEAMLVSSEVAKLACAHGLQRHKPTLPHTGHAKGHHRSSDATVAPYAFG